MTPFALLLSSFVLATCPASHVHYAPDPAAAGGLRAIPWVETSNGAFVGHLFYVGGTPWRTTKPVAAHIFTTRVKRSVNPKVLWLPKRSGDGARLTIRGSRLGGAGSFTWTGERVPGNQFPSYVPVPSPGCWRVTVSSGGLSGSVVFAAVDTF